jgi:hypothetical protein
MGLQYFRRDLSAGVFFLGVFLTGFSSSYYHWNPNDAGLFWDRLPMAIAFMAILANVVEERIDAKVGKLLLWPLVLLGIVSLLWWMRTDDLRLYGWVQFFPCLVLPLMFWLFAPKYSGTWYWFAAAGCYLFAKVLEYPTRSSIRRATTSWPATRSSMSRRPAPATRSCVRSRPGKRSSGTRWQASVSAARRTSPFRILSTSLAGSGHRLAADRRPIERATSCLIQSRNARTCGTVLRCLGQTT